VINTIEELVALTGLEAAQDLEEGFPEIAERSRLRTPGLSEDEVAELLKAFPGMPASYLDIARRVSLFHTDIGYFSVGPYQWAQCDNYLDGLKDTNSPKLWYFDLLEPYKLYVVGSHDTDLIAVAREGTTRPGEVFVIMDYCIPDPRVRRLAWNYEQVLLSFGRVREAFVNKRFDDESIAEVNASVRSDFNLNNEQMDWWEMAIEQALDEDPAEPVELVEKAPLPTNTSKPERSWLPSFLRRSSPK
jgi:hypothetical protein